MLAVFLVKKQGVIFCDFHVLAVCCVGFFSGKVLQVTTTDSFCCKCCKDVYSICQKGSLPSSGKTGFPGDLWFNFTPKILGKSKPSFDFALIFYWKGVLQSPTFVQILLVKNGGFRVIFLCTEFCFVVVPESCSSMVPWWLWKNQEIMKNIIQFYSLSVLNFWRLNEAKSFFGGKAVEKETCKKKNI